MSDVHGMDRAFFYLLTKVSFGEQDVLYILGDVAGKGPRALPVYDFAMCHQNVRLLRGNHEERLLQYFGKTEKGAPRIPDEVMCKWTAGDGAPTIRELCRLRDKERDRLLEFLSQTLLSCRISEAGQDYLLVHGAPGPDGSCSGYDVLENRYESLSAPKRVKGTETVIVGHTPTFKYDRSCAGKIVIRPDKIFLDCGAGSGYGLGILDLRNKKAYYGRKEEATP